MNDASARKMAAMIIRDFWLTMAMPKTVGPTADSVPFSNRPMCTRPMLIDGIVNTHWSRMTANADVPRAR